MYGLDALAEANSDNKKTVEGLRKVIKKYLPNLRMIVQDENEWEVIYHLMTDRLWDG